MTSVSTFFSDRKMEDFPSSEEYDSQEISNNTNGSKLVIGYYNLRGKAQVPRLLLEYLRVDYEDKLFTLAEWQKYSQTKTKDFAFAVLPFLRQGHFVCTDSVPMCTYIILRFGNPDLLGRTLKDQAIIEMYFWTIPYMQTVISINSVQMKPQELAAFKEKQWHLNVLPRIMKMEEAASDEQWFLGYLTIIDFSIYQLIRYMDNIFEGKTKTLKKLKKIEEDFGNIPVIKQYQSSERAIVEWCPTKLLQSFKAMMNKNDQKSSQNGKIDKKKNK